MPVAYWHYSWLQRWRDRSLDPSPHPTSTRGTSVSWTFLLSIYDRMRWLVTWEPVPRVHRGTDLTWFYVFDSFDCCEAIAVKCRKGTPQPARRRMARGSVCIRPRCANGGAQNTSPDALPISHCRAHTLHLHSSPSFCISPSPSPAPLLRYDLPKPRCSTFSPGRAFLAPFALSPPL